MRYLSILYLSTFLLADSNVTEHIKLQLQKEQKYAKEQKFYNESEYDFKSLEVTPSLIDKVPVQEIDDLDMDDVYD